MIPTWPSFSEEEILAVTAVLRSGKVNYWTGNETKLFEAEFAAYVGVRHSIAMMNGTVALEAALYALDIGAGDEVIVPCRTFIASASCVVARGATPVVADIDQVSQNLTVETIRTVLSKKTKAIIVVHLAGWPCDMDSIMSFAKEHNLYVIEDCAQAHGAVYKGRPVGSIGHVGAFSFCQDKIMTTGGEGGMVTTNDEILWKRMWEYKDHGKSWDAVNAPVIEPGFRWLHASFGTNWRMTEMQAAIGRLQLKKLDDWRAIRRQHAARLTTCFSAYPMFRLTLPPDFIQHAFYKYYVFIKPDMLPSGWSRDLLISAFNNAGVPCFSGSCSEIYLEKAFTKMDLNPEKRFSVAQGLGETSLMFLVHPTLTETDMIEITNRINRVLETLE